MDNQELVEVNSEIERINSRVANIELIVSSIEGLAEKGLEAFTKHLDHKEEIQQKEIELQNTIHKRSVVIVGATVVGVVALVFTAMLLGEKELVKTILTSSLAVGAGFGVKSALNKSKG